MPVNLLIRKTYSSLLSFPKNLWQYVTFNEFVIAFIIPYY